jgi:hypothetical protein
MPNISSLKRETYFDDKCYKVGFVVFPFLYWFYFFPTLYLFWSDGGCNTGIEGVGDRSFVWFE